MVIRFSLIIFTHPKAPDLAEVSELYLLGLVSSKHFMIKFS